MRTLQSGFLQVVVESTSPVATNGAPVRMTVAVNVLFT